MQSFNGFTLIFLAGLIVLFLIILVIGGFVIFRTSKKRDEKLRIEHEKQKSYRQSIRLRGVTAPAVIVSAKRVTGGRSTHVIDFSVEIQPEGRPSFSAVFRDEISRSNYEVKDYQMADEIGRKIWVTYDPADLSHMFLDHYDDDHQAVLMKRELDKRREEFDEHIAEKAGIKKTGEKAEGVITNVEDLNLPYPAVYPSKGMRLQVNVTSNEGSTFLADIDAIISEKSIEKFSVGKKVFVRFDPRDLKRVVLDTERNKKL